MTSRQDLPVRLAIAAVTTLVAAAGVTAQAGHEHQSVGDRARYGAAATPGATLIRTGRLELSVPDRAFVEP